MRTPPRTVDAALREARVPTDAPTAAHASLALHRLEHRAQEGAEPAPVVPWPAPPLSRAEQAGRDLDLATTMIVTAPTAAASLGGLLDQRRIDPAGALVFAALLHLAGNGDGARFWWEFAAGTGDATAAFCLGLLHEGRAEFRTARHWRRQNLALVRGDREGRGPRRRIVRTLLRGGAPRILSDDVRHDLIARCHQGDKPALPAAVEAVVHGLGVDGDDGDFGEVPRPDASLISLNHRPARRRWSARGTVRRTWATFVIRRRTRASPTRRLTAVRV